MKHEFSFRWEIENYSLSTVRDLGALLSPAFQPEGLGGASWSLSLNKYALTYGWEGGVWLTRSARDAGPASVRLKLEISATFGGSTLFSEECERDFKKAEMRGFGASVNLKELYEGRSAEDASRDTLCVLCRMWWGEGGVERVKQCTARTRIGQHKVSFLHRVEKFSALKPDEKKVLHIPSQSDGGCDFTSTLCIGEVYSSEDVWVSTVPSNKNYRICQMKLSLIDVYGNITEFHKCDYRFWNFGFPPFPTKQFIVDKRKEYLPNDELTLLCECTFFTGVKQAEIEETLHEIPAVVYQHKYSIPQDRNDRKLEQELSAHPSAPQETKLNHKDQRPTNEDSKVNKLPEISNANSTNPSGIYNQMRNIDPHTNRYNAAQKLSSCPSVQDDFKTLYKDQFLTDIVLKTATKSFPAHRIVLCARSSVFKAMLSNEMKEKITDCIRVEDLEDETVKKLLLFLYTDFLEELQWESAIQLYYAADKYAVEKLKVLSSSFLVDNLSSSRASELLLLADTHSDAELKKLVEDFILEHEKEVFGSDEWERLIETNPQLVIKTMHLKYKREKGGK